jgi:hypothetical protein
MLPLGLASLPPGSVLPPPGPVALPDMPISFHPRPGVAMSSALGAPRFWRGLDAM